MPIHVRLRQSRVFESLRLDRFIFARFGVITVILIGTAPFLMMLIRAIIILAPIDKLCRSMNIIAILISP